MDCLSLMQSSLIREVSMPLLMHPLIGTNATITVRRCLSSGVRMKVRKAAILSYALEPIGQFGVRLPLHLKQLSILPLGFGNKFSNAKSM